jgi:hypothetical protein
LRRRHGDGRLLESFPGSSAHIQKLGALLGVSNTLDARLIGTTWRIDAWFIDTWFIDTWLIDLPSKGSPS